MGAMVSASAQVMYRCGNTFSQQPCGVEAKELPNPGVAQPRKMEAMPPDIPASAEMIEAARKMCESSIAAQLKDPDSAKFGSPLRGELRRTAAGNVLRDYYFSVNARNSFGGYTGVKSWTCSLDPAESSVRWSGPSGP